MQWTDPVNRVEHADVKWVTAQLSANQRQRVASRHGDHNRVVRQQLGRVVNGRVQPAVTDRHHDPEIKAVRRQSTCLNTQSNTQSTCLNTQSTCLNTEYLSEYTQYMSEYIEYLSEHIEYLSEYTQYLTEYIEYLTEYTEYMSEYKK